MKLLTFQARRFRWKSHSQTLPGVQKVEVDETANEAVVVFVHAESCDESAEARSRAFRHTLKHIKWLAGKRGWKRVVLHSFTHLGGENAEPDFAEEFLRDLSDRLISTGYEVRCTPFGYFCEWDLAVHGDSLAKVWKQI